MEDEDKTKSQLLAELQKMREHIAELEQAKIAWQSTETTLRQSEENLHTLLNSIGDAVIATDSNGNVIRLNPVAEKLTGYKMNEAEGNPLSKIFRIFNSQSREKADDLVNQVIDSGKITRLTSHAMLIARDGREYQIADSAAPILDAEGNITGAVLVFRDVTEAYKTQEKLQESEKKLKQNLDELNAIINALPGIVSVVDTEFNVLVANDEVYKRFGQKGLHEVIGNPCYATRKGLEQPCPQCALLSAFKTGETISRVSTPEEEGLMGISTKSYAIPLKDERGVIWGGVEVIMDITDIRKTEESLRKSEEKYRVLIDGMRDTVWVIDFDGNFIDMNNAAIETLGYSREELLSMGPVDIDSNLDVGAIKNLIIKIPSDKIQVFETVHTTKEGKPIPVEIQSCVVEYLGKDAILSIGRDITERKRAEIEKEKLETQLRQAHKMESIGTIAGGIAHDFNNILASVVGYTELALDDAEKGTMQYQNLQEVLLAGNRAAELVKQILTFSRQTDQEQKPVKVRLIIIEALKLLRSTIPSSIEIRQNIQSNALIIGDSTQVQQVLMNLCTNAAHAMADKGGSLTIDLSDVELDSRFVSNHPDLKPGPYIKLEVIDTGHGIHPSNLQQIFDPFFTTKEKGEGTGLGLSVVHGIVHSHGGAIYCYSELGKGSTFKVYLPAVERYLKPEQRIEKPIPTGNERILLIDDEPSLVNMGKQILQSLGYDVTTRTSSVEALELFKSQKDRFDLVITDMTMPKMTGESLSRELMKIRHDIPVILCTGFSARIDEKKALDMGIRAFVSKPILKREIAETIRAVLDGL